MACPPGPSSSDVEILVHVSAPSMPTDDAHYRRLARAYLAFQPQKRTKATATPPTEHHAVNADPAHGSHRGDVVPSSQDLSFQSVLDNRLSPRPRTPERKPVAGSWQAPASQVSDSYPMPDANVLNITPTRVLQQYLHQYRSSTSYSPPSSQAPEPVPHQNDAPAPLLSQDADVPSSVPIADTEQHTYHLQHYMRAPKTIPVTPNEPEAQLRKRSAPADLVQDHNESGLFDMTHISSSDLSLVSHTTSLRVESEPPPAKRLRSGLDDDDAAVLVRSSSDSGAPRSTVPFSTMDSCHDSLEIWSPPPPAGVTDIEPASLVSEKLAKLARDLSSRYRPECRRELGPLERGYWLLDCTPWSVDARLDAWAFLAGYLRSGVAGWGLWCHRDAPCRWIRLYCWAYTAKHAYLLLYLASVRKIKATGAQWFGPDGEMALVVPPTSKHDAK